MRACFILLFSLVTCGAFGQNEWIAYQSSQNDFKVLFPQEPTEHSKDLYTEIGSLKSNNYMVAMDKKSNNFLYSINTVTFPEGTFSPDSLAFNEETLLAQVQALSANLKCELIYQNSTTVSEQQAISFRLGDKKSGQVVKGMIVLYNDKMFTITVFTMLEKSLNKEIDTFLQSFSLML